MRSLCRGRSSTCAPSSSARSLHRGCGGHAVHNVRSYLIDCARPVSHRLLVFPTGNIDCTEPDRCSCSPLPDQPLQLLLEAGARLLQLVLAVPRDQLVQVARGVARRVHLRTRVTCHKRGLQVTALTADLVSGVECGEVDLELVVVLPVELHLLEPVAPHDLAREVARPEW